MGKYGSSIRSSPPTGAFVVSLIGGVVILLNALLYLLVAAAISQLPGMPGYDPATMPGVAQLGEAQTVLYVLSGIGLVVAGLIIYSSVALYRSRAHNVAYGTAIIVLSAASMVIGGGFIAGMVIGIVGGILALVWRPVSVVPAVAPN